MVLTEQVKQEAIRLGFDLVGITDASPIPQEHVDYFLRWLSAGCAGQMTHLHRNLDKRIDPAKLFPGAKSVIVVGLNYKPPLSLRANQSAALQSQPAGYVASYARYEDYHLFIKKQLRKLAAFIAESAGHWLKFQICVDSAPLFERALAVRAGLGFIGKNRMLTNTRLGPQILLGEIITNLDLDKSAISNQQSAISTCRSCDKCIAACPTGALKPDGCFDATKCINYLTIESDTEIPSDLARKIGNRLFGCSECLLACPHQHNAPPCANSRFTFYPERAFLDLNEIINLTEDRFRIKFADSPILRAGLPRLQRTAKICLDNLSP